MKLCDVVTADERGTAGQPDVYTRLRLRTFGNWRRISFCMFQLFYVYVQMCLHSELPHLDSPYT